MKIGIALTIAALAAVAQAADHEAGRKEEARACVACHSLRLIHSQRLSRVGWEKELDKMVKWGTVIRDRPALLDYLAAEYSDAKPVPQPDLSGDGSK
jgi:hypothetical protein